MRASVIGIQPSGGCTPLDAPSQFSQYPCSTLPAGRDFTGHVVCPGGCDDGGGEEGGGEDGGRVDGGGEDGGRVDGGGEEGGGVPPVQAPRSRQSEGVAAGFQPAPTWAVCPTRAS